MRCTHCGSFTYTKNGKYKGIQRYKCKNCNRSFSDKVRKFSFADKEKFLKLYLNGFGIRKSAEYLGCSHSLLLRWIREFASNLKTQLVRSAEELEPDSIPDVIEMDEIFTRVKKGGTEFQYGLLIVGGVVKLLHL